MEEKKKCSKCLVVMPLKAFKLYQIGIGRICKDCCEKRERGLKFRICTKCCKTKPLRSFRLNKTGLSRRCKVCIKTQPKPGNKDVFMNLKLKLRSNEYRSIQSKAQTMGYSVDKYVLFLHEQNMRRK